MQGLLEHHGDRGIVDILRGQTKMDKLLVGIHPADGINLLLNEIFDSLDIVVRHGFYLLHACGIRFAELLVDGAQGSKTALVKVGQLREGNFAQCNKVFDFYAGTVLHQRVLRKVRSQGGCLVTITAINRRDGGEDV